MAMQTFVSRSKGLWLHISFWCVYLSFNLYQLSFYQRRVEEFDWTKGIFMTLLQLLSTMLIAYLNYFYFLPRLLQGKKAGRYVLGFLVSFGVILFARTVLQRYIIDGYSHREHFFYSNMFIVQTVAITLFIVIFIGMLKFLGDWFEFEARKKEVENEKLTTELNFLKAQINPHFLFNTLNNLYYLAYSKSDNTTEVIAKLSQMMRYMIYDSNHPKVLLSKEIEYMESYISLERLRLNNQIPINFNISGDVQGVWIAPLILITFLENAFKHGVSNNHAQAWVDIAINVAGKACTYVVKNSKVEKNLDNLDKSGIGLKNVMRRLELSYPDRYEIKVSDDREQYAVELKLILE